MIAFTVNDYKILEIKLKCLIKEILSGKRTMNNHSYTIDFKPVYSYLQKYKGTFYGLTEIEVIMALCTDNYYKFYVYFRFQDKTEIYKVLRVYKINNRYQYKLS